MARRKPSNIVKRRDTVNTLNNSISTINEYIIGDIDRSIESTTKEINKWHSEFSKDPLCAMRWSRGMMQAACLQRVWIDVKRMTESGSSIDQCVAVLASDLSRVSGDDTTSLDPISNVVSNYERVALHTVHRLLSLYASTLTRLRGERDELMMYSAI